MRGFPEQLLQQQADAGFSLAALAGHDQHLLRLGRRDQEIAKVFLQGQNVLRDEQTVQKFQPLGRCGGIGLVFHGEPVQAEFLFRHKAPLVQKVGSVLEMDAVKLGFPFGGYRFRYGVRPEPASPSWQGCRAQSHGGRCGLRRAVRPRLPRRSGRTASVSGTSWGVSLKGTGSKRFHALCPYCLPKGIRILPLLPVRPHHANRRSSFFQSLMQSLPILP